MTKSDKKVGKISIKDRRRSVEPVEKPTPKVKKPRKVKRYGWAVDYRGKWIKPATWKNWYATAKDRDSGMRSFEKTRYCYMGIYQNLRKIYRTPRGSSSRKDTRL